MKPATGHSGRRSYEFGDFRLDPSERILLHCGERIPLPPKAFQTLVLLVQNPGRVLSKDELMQSLWPDTFVEEGNLYQCITSLRKALTNGQNGGAYIETVPRLGYRFVGAVREASGQREEIVSGAEERRREDVLEEGRPPDAAAKATVEAQKETEPDALRLLRKRMVWFAAAMLLVSIGFVYVSRLRTTKSWVQADVPLSVAVVPFRNLQPNSDSDYLGFALADITGGQLSYEGQVVLRPSTSVLKYSTADRSLGKLEPTGLAQSLLRGTYLKQGQTVRLDLELVSEPGQTTLWRGNFATSVDGLRSLPNLAGEQISAALHRKFHAIEAGASNGARLRNTPAYEDFLRGVDALERQDPRTAIQWLEKATQLDPGSSLVQSYQALAYIAYCYWQSSYGDWAPIETEYLNKALALDQKVLETNGASPAVLTTSGLYLMELGRLEDSVKLLRKARQLSPNYAEAHLWLSQAYRYGGALRDSQKEAELALQIDRNITERSTINAYLYLGEYDKFLETMPHAQWGARNFFYRGLARYYQGDKAGAERDFRQAYEMEPALPHAQFGHAIVRAMAGEKREGIEELRGVEKTPPADGEMLYKLAEAYAALGDKPAALRVLLKSVEAGFYCHPYFLRDSLLDSLRSEKEFAELMAVARERHEAFLRRFF